MLLEASVVVTGGFVILPLVVAAGFVLTDEWAGRRLGEESRCGDAALCSSARPCSRGCW